MRVALEKRKEVENENMNDEKQNSGDRWQKDVPKIKKIDHDSRIKNKIMFKRENRVWMQIFWKKNW